jgi:NAD(P)-dependent dehydrogenase (short-subunit alcohol dehydrogenase family)
MKKQRTTNVQMDGWVCVVTGANSGVGFETSVQLAKHGAHLVMVCRSPMRGEAARTRIGAVSKGPVDLIIADLSSLEEVRRLARTLLDRYPKIHVLINNAGQYNTQRLVTVDGFEAVFAVNYLAPFLLTHLLLDRIKASAPSRILNVNSKGHQFGGLDLNDLHWKKRKYRGLKGYGASKTAGIMFTRELAHRLKGTGVTVLAVHPGEVLSNIGLNNGVVYRTFRKLVIDQMLKPTSLAGEALYYLAASPEVESRSGRYFNMTHLEKPFPHALDRTVARTLWLVSEQLTGLVAPSTSG